MPGEFPVYGASGLLGYINTYHQEREYIGIVKDGSGIGRVMFLPPQSSCIGTMQYILPKPGYDINYIGYCLDSLGLKSYKQGAAIPHIYFKDYGERVVNVVDNIEEQRAIVSKINTEFAAIDQIKQNAANSLEEAKSLFCSTLEDAIRQRADWRKVKVSEIATDMYRGSGIKRDQVTKDGTPCVRYGEIYTSYNYSFSECISHTQESLISSKKYFEHGDILFAITGESVEDIGKCVAYTGTEKCLLGGDIIAMKHHENPKFLAYALSTKEAIKQKGKGKTKLKVVHTNYADLRDISINLPKDLSEQSSIAAKLDTVFSYVQQVENNCAEISKNCTELKQSILRNIFN